MQNRSVLAYRTALHRFSLAGCPERYNHPKQMNYIISEALWQGAYFLYPFYRCDIATERRMIYGTVKNKETRINLAIQL